MKDHEAIRLLVAQARTVATSIGHWPDDLHVTLRCGDWEVRVYLSTRLRAACADLREWTGAAPHGVRRVASGMARRDGSMHDAFDDLAADIARQGLDREDGGRCALI